MTTTEGVEASPVGPLPSILTLLARVSATT